MNNFAEMIEYGQPKSASKNSKGSYDINFSFEYEFLTICLDEDFNADRWIWKVDEFSEIQISETDRNYLNKLAEQFGFKIRFGLINLNGVRY